MSYSWHDMTGVFAEVEDELGKLLDRRWSVDDAIAYYEDTTQAAPARDLTGILAEHGWIGLFALAPDAGGGDVAQQAAVLRTLGQHLAPFAATATARTAALLGMVGGDAAAPLVARLEAGAVGAWAEGSVDGDRVEARRVPGAHEADVLLMVLGDQVHLATDATTTPVALFGRRTVCDVSVSLDRLEPLGRIDPHLWRARNRLLTAVELVGVGDGLIRRSVDYVKVREQFGRPIGKFQAVQHLLADTYIAVDAARMLAYDGIARSLEDALRPGDAERAHLLAARAAQQAGVVAHQVHGGMGYVRESPVHLYSESARLLGTVGGTVRDDLDHLMARIRTGADDRTAVPA